MKTKLLLSALFLSAVMQAQTYSMTGAVTIIDAPTGCGDTGIPTLAAGTVNVPLTGTLTNAASLTINLGITHTWMGDLVMELETPAGTKCALIKRIGAATDAACGSGSNFIGANVLSFNSANTAPVPALPATGIPAGSYAPTGPTAPSTFPATIPLCNLATFLNGVAINGAWKMNTYDHGGGDTGTLDTFSLVFTGLSGEEFVFTNAVSVLGNPFENELVVKVNNLSTSTAVMNLYAMDGKLVNTTNVTNFEQSTSIETSKLTQGVYLLVAEIDGVAQKAIRVIKR